MGLTFAGAASAAAWTGWIGFGYSITRSLAKDLREAKGAGLMAFEVSGGHVSKDTIQKAGDLGAEKVVDAMEKKVKTHADLLEQAEHKIAQLSRRVQNKVSTAKIAKLGRQIQRAEAAGEASGKAMTRARIVGVGARSLQVVFAAHDVYEGWEEFEEVWNAP